MTIEKSQKIVSRIVDGNLLILNTTNNAIFSLNSTGMLIWNLIDKNGEIEDIANNLVALYNIPLEKAETDVLKLVYQLEKNKLIYLSDKK